MFPFDLQKQFQDKPEEHSEPQPTSPGGYPGRMSKRSSRLPFLGLLHSWGPSPQASGFLHLNSRQRELLPGRDGEDLAYDEAGANLWISQMYSFAHPGFSGQPHCWQFLLVPGQAGLGAEPTAGLGSKSRLLREALRSNLFAFFPPCGLSTFTSKVCWVCTNHSQQHACESSSSFEILTE